mmetsp:Transcript_27830/g.41206  ORF Transcript_27830/g.41206 Transcript_27830/m.41206 type:complete len:95 (-) Transcript_27830:185-469(-)
MSKSYRLILIIMATTAVPIMADCFSTSNCFCLLSHCNMPNCTKNCECAFGNCEMPKCEKNCQCSWGNCEMPICETGCMCFMGQCTGMRRNLRHA